MRLFLAAMLLRDACLPLAIVDGVVDVDVIYVFYYPSRPAVCHGLVFMSKTSWPKIVLRKLSLINKVVFIEREIVF